MTGFLLGVVSPNSHAAGLTAGLTADRGADCFNPTNTKAINLKQFAVDLIGVQPNK